MTPRQLAEEIITLTSAYEIQSEQLADILADKPLTWAAIRSGVNSDKAADRKWEETEEGREEITLRLKLKALEKAISAKKTMLRVLEGEARNQY